MKNIVNLFFLVLLFLPIAASAEIKEIICEGTYNMGDGETPSVAESRALLQAKRVAIEQAGTYVESYSKVKNLQLTEDEIKIMASGIMEVTTLDKKRTVVGDGFHFWIKIKALVNSDKMEEMARKVKDKPAFEEMKKIQTAYDKSQKDIEELKKQLLLAKGDQKKEVEGKIAGDEKRFQVNQWYEKALGYYYKSFWAGTEWDKATEAFTVVIGMDPQNGHAYSYRAFCYISSEHNYDKALSDYRKSLSLCNEKCQEKDEFSLLYGVTQIGNHYAEMNEHYKAIEVFTMLSGLYDKYTYDPLYKEINNLYYNRGNSYTAIGQYNMAIRDYDTALEISINARPMQGMIYNNRGTAYYYTGNMRKAFADYKKACDLGEPKGCKNSNIIPPNMR